MASFYSPVNEAVHWLIVVVETRKKGNKKKKTSEKLPFKKINFTARRAVVRHCVAIHADRRRRRQQKGFELYSSGRPLMADSRAFSHPASGAVDLR